MIVICRAESERAFEEISSSKRGSADFATFSAGWTSAPHEINNIGHETDNAPTAGDRFVSGVHVYGPAT